MTKKLDIFKVLVFITVLFFYGSFLLTKMKIPAADDLPRQIKIGQEVVSGNWDILYKNTFAYTEPDFKFYNHHWFSGVVFYFLSILSGWSGLVYFKVLILLLTFSIIFRLSLKRGDFWVSILISIPTIFLLRERSMLRPEVFSYLLIAVYLYLLYLFDKNPKSKLIFLLIPLQLLCVNMHIFFSIGIMLVGGFFFEKIIQNINKLKNNYFLKKTLVILCLMIMVSFINPRGIDGVFYKYPSVEVGISENQSIMLSQRIGDLQSDISIFLFKPVVFFAILSLILYLIYLRRLYRENRSITKTLSEIPIFYIVALFATAFLTTFVVRGMAMFGYMFLLTMPTILHWQYLLLKESIVDKFPVINKYIGYFFITTLFVALGYIVFLSQSRFFGYITQRGSGLSSMSEAGAKFFINNRLKGPIFNDADIGSYLIYYLYPKEKVFSDNRFGDAYSKEFWDEYLRILSNEENWQNALKKYEFNTIFLYQYDSGDSFRQFMYNRMHDPEWVFVYGDTYSIIFLRNIPENQDLIERYRIDINSAEERLKFLTTSDIEDDLISAADIFNMVGRLDIAREIFFDVVTKRPSNGKIWMIMAEWELISETKVSSILSAMFLEKAIQVGHKTSEAYSFLGLAYYRLGKIEKAKEVLNKALELNPERYDALDLYSKIEREYALIKNNNE